MTEPVTEIRTAVLIAGVVMLLMGLDRLVNSYWLGGTTDARALIVIAVGVLVIGAGLPPRRNARQSPEHTTTHDGAQDDPPIHPSIGPSKPMMRTSITPWAVGPTSDSGQAADSQGDTMPKWIKPGVWGLVIGGVLTMVVGFGWGGWVTGATAQQQAREQADTAVTSALVPFCLAKAKMDPTSAKKIGELRAITYSYEQGQFVVQSGWATLAESSEPNRSVAEACAAQLLKTAQAS